MKPRRRYLGAFLFLVATLVPGSASGQDTSDEVERLSAEGITAFNAARYQEALEKFQTAYRLYQAPNLLFNIARCHQGLGDIDRAIASFKQYLEQPNIDPKTKVIAEGKLRDLEEIRRKNQEKEQADREGPIKTKEALDGPGWTEGRSAGTTRRTPRGSFWRSPTLRWVTLGVGVGLIAAGSTLLALGASDYDSVENAPERKPGIKDMTQQEAREIVDGGESKSTVGMVLASVGGAALAASAVLFFVSHGNDERAARSVEQRLPGVTVGVSPLPGGGSAMLGGSF